MAGRSSQPHPSLPPSVVLGLLRAARLEEPRFAVDGDYATTKQANAASIPGWRRQVVQWLFEASRNPAGLRR